MKVIAPAIKIDYENIDAILEKAKKQAEATYKSNDCHVWHILGTLNAAYKDLCGKVDRQHNNAIEETNIEAHTELLLKIAEDAVHISGTDYRIGERHIDEIERVLNSK